MTDPNIESSPVGTKDLDSLIQRRLPKVAEKDIASYLEESGYVRIFKDLHNPATEAYVKEIEGTEVEIEFLTDSSTRGDKNNNVKIEGIVAQPLSYISLSLGSTTSFKTKSGEDGIVVSPEPWIFHKGLTFSRRNVASKVYKDLYGIWYVATHLSDFSQNTLTRFHVLAQQHPKWFKTFCKNIEVWLEEANQIDWNNLETQDPDGKLKQLNFKHMCFNLSQLRTSF